MMFALEEIHRSFSEYVLVAGLTAAIAADIMACLMFGQTPVLDFMTVPDVKLELYIWLIPCGIVAGILGFAMNKGYMTVKHLFARIPSKYVFPAALLIALPVGLYLPDALGGGEDLVRIAEKAEIGLAAIATLLLVKMVFSFTSFGCGAPGGIFMPIIAVGALGGAATGLVLTYFGMPQEFVCNCAVMGMAGCLASSLRTPVTAVLLVTEMTASLVHLLPVALCVLVAYTVSGLLKTRPIYRLLLSELVEKNPDLTENAGKPLSQIIKEQY